MTYTTQQLQEISDDDLGVAFYDKFGINFDCYSEIMPLAFERKIRLEYSHLMEWWAASVWKKTDAREQTMVASFGDKDNPLRAIACLLLMMDE